MTCIIDIKSNHAHPATRLQLAAYTLLDTPVSFQEEGHIYTDGDIRLPSVTQILQAEGFIDTSFYTEYGRDRGSYVHMAIALDIANDLDDDNLDPALVPYFMAWRRFWDETKFKITSAENPMMSSIYRFAGTPDIIGEWPTKGPSRAALELKNDGSYRLIPYTDRNDVKIWLSALSVHNFKKNMKGK